MSRFKTALPDLLVIVVLFLLPLGFFFQQTAGNRTLIPTENLYQYEPFATYREEAGAPSSPHNHLLSDLVLQNYQWKLFARTQIAAGEVPLWNPHQFSGIPFLAAGQHSMLYPLSVVYLILPLTAAYGWFTVLNLWLAGVFTFAFARSLGISRGGGLLAGVVYQFNGFVIASVVFPMMIGGYVWLPLLLLAIECLIRDRQLLPSLPGVIPWVVVGAVATGMNILAGHAEITIYTLLIAAYYAAFRLIVQALRTRDWRGFVRRGAVIAATVALGVSIGAVQLIPLYEFVQTNWRAERSDYDTVVGYAHPMRDMVQFVLPNFYGSPAHHSVYDVFNGQTVTDFAPAQNHTDWGIKNYVEAALYLGILPLLLAGYALVDRLLLWRVRTRSGAVAPEPPYRLLFIVLAILSLSFMFGLPTYRLIYGLPGINQLNSPFRWVYALTLCVAMLAAFGLDGLVRRAAATRQRVTMAIGTAAILQGVVVIVGLLLLVPFYDRIAPLIERVFNSLALATRAFNTPELFFSYQFGNVMIYGVVLVLCGVVFFWAGWMRGFVGVRWLTVLAVAVTVVDLFVASWGFNPASDPQLLDYTPPAIEWLQAQDGDFRYTTLDDPAQRAILNANAGWMYGLDDVRGYDSIISAQYVDFMRGAYPQVQLDHNRIAPLYTTYADEIGFDATDGLASDALDLLNVRYVVAHRSTTIDAAGYEQVYQDEAVRIYENTDALPRAFLTQAPDQLPDADVTPVEIMRDTGREKLLNLSLDEAATLVISESYAPGWRAYLRQPDAGEDGESALTVELVAGNLQGVEVPAGDWTLRLVYSPMSFQVGFFGSVMSIIAMTLMVGIWLWRVFVGQSTDDTSTTARVARNSIAPIILNLFNRGIDFVFAIVMYRLLTQEEVGVYTFAVVVFVWFDIFTNFGLDLFLIREVSQDKARSGFYFFNTTTLRLWLSVVGLGILFVFMAAWQQGAEPLPSDGLVAMVLLYVGLFPASLSKGMTSLYYAYEQAEKPAAIATITTINKAVFGVIVLVLGYGIVGLAAVSILNNILTFAVLVWAGRALIGRIRSWRPDFSLIRNMVSESLPLMLNHFLATIFFQFDIVILQALRGAVIQAQYSTSYKWLLAINIIPAFFTQALFPVMSRQAAEDKAALQRSYSFGIKLLVTLAIPLAVAFTALADVLTLILAGPSYLPDAAIALRLMIWSIPFGWMNSLTQYALIALGLQRALTWAFFGAVSFNVITNLIFIPQFGYRAAAVTTIASEAILLLPFAILMQRGLNMRINWADLVWRQVAAGVVMIAVMLLLYPVGQIIALVVGAAAYAGCLLLLKPLNAHEADQLRDMIPERFRETRVVGVLLGGA